MTCPFLKEAQVKYCQTSSVLKLIPIATAGRADDKCSSQEHLTCPTSASPWPMAVKNLETRKKSNRHDLPVSQRSSGQVLPDVLGPETDSPRDGRPGGREMFLPGTSHVPGLPHRSEERRVGN